MNILLGIGNTDRGDDGVGPFIASRFRHPGWLCLDAGTVPENFTGVIRRHRPELLVLVDAADMGLPPGSVRRVPRAMIQDTGWSSHMLPLYHVIDYLADAVNGDIQLIGIQPSTREFGEPIHPALLKAAEDVMQQLAGGHLASIPLLES